MVGKEETQATESEDLSGLKPFAVETKTTTATKRDCWDCLGIVRRQVRIVHTDLWFLIKAEPTKILVRRPT